MLGIIERIAIKILRASKIDYIYRNDSEYEFKRRIENPLFLDRFGYKIFSQNDEDGIINEIFNRIGTTNKRFVEFGVSNGLECNSHFLLHKGWNGLWIEGNKKYCNQINRIFKEPINTNQLKLTNSFITIENINEIIGMSVTDELDFLSIDIDGNDYWIWKAIDCINPRVVAIEYNSKFPPPFEWIMPYDAKHIWDGSDYHGASLEALDKLGRKMDYQLVGTSMKGANAFFVKRELTESLFPYPATAMNLYNPLSLRCYLNSGHKTKKYTGLF